MCGEILADFISSVSGLKQNHLIIRLSQISLSSKSSFLVCYNNNNNNNNNNNKYWTKWSTIQGVIARVISKSDEHKAWDRFEIMSTITPWMVRHEVQVLINHIYNKFWNEKCLWEAKTSVALFINVENCAEHCERVIKACVNDM